MGQYRPMETSVRSYLNTQTESVDRRWPRTSRSVVDPGGWFTKPSSLSQYPEQTGLRFVLLSIREKTSCDPRSWGWRNETSSLPSVDRLSSGWSSWSVSIHDRSDLEEDIVGVWSDPRDPMWLRLGLIHYEVEGQTRLRIIHRLVELSQPPMTGVVVDRRV